MICTLHHRWRWAWLAYPATTTAVVIATANHYWLDCLAGTAIVLAILPLARRLTPATSTPAPRPAGRTGIPTPRGPQRPSVAGGDERDTSLVAISTAEAGELGTRDAPGAVHGTPTPRRVRASGALAEVRRIIRSGSRAR
jgi:hypothetical protein